MRIHLPRPRLPRLRLARPGVAGTCVLVLLAAGAAANLAPLPGSGCPSTVLALTAAAEPTPTDAAPELSAEVAQADAARVSAAQAALADHADAVAAAQKSLDAAAVLGESADRAESEAVSGSYDSGFSYEVTSAESAVETAEMMLDFAEDRLQGLLDQQANATPGDYFGPEYYDDDIASARSDVADAKAELAEANEDLAAARAEERAEEADQAQKQSQADSLRDKADAAAEQAMELVQQATAVQRDLAAAVERAEATRDAHVAQHQADLARWTHENRLATDEVRAVNAVRADCRDAGIRALGVAGGLLVVAVVVGLGSRVASRR